jgi:chemotaxis protein methyltransferase CheR
MSWLDIEKIVGLLKEQRGLDFSGYRNDMLMRRIEKRFFATKCKNANAYIDYLHNQPKELDNLIDAFTINFSGFFRNPLTFEYLAKIIFPDLFLSKTIQKGNCVRIWSAGCAFGEEPYSLAILINELIEKEKPRFNLSFFATDIDKKALKRANEGVYSFESVKEVRYGLLKKYFKWEGDRFIFNAEFKKAVQFSFYDLMDKNSTMPPDSIFGNFDIVMCRNVLIYFDAESQEVIFNKLYKSLKTNGYLVLGEAEVPIAGFNKRFKLENKCCKIYKKIS